MIRTRVGYTGGSKDSPSYHNLGRHTEALQVDFDPATLTYTELLAKVFHRHDPFSNISHTQYKNALWYHGERQYEQLEAFLTDHYDCKPEDSSVETTIEPIDTFHRAEDYHQKYYLRKYDSYMALFEEHSPRDFTDSTRAARLNGILAGKANSLDPFDELEALALPDRLERDLKSRVR